MQQRIGILYILILFHSCPRISGEDEKQPSQISEGDIDKQTYERYKDQVCKQNPAFAGSEAGAEDQSKWSDGLSESEILELAFVNMAYGLGTDSISYLKEELGWKKSVLDVISLVTKATCEDDVISEGFLNTAKNLFLYYMVKQSKGAGPSNITDARIKEWDEVIKALKSCASDVDPIEFGMDCGTVKGYMSKDGVELPVIVGMERLDDEVQESANAGGEMGLDVVIDTVWWMFSTTYARCYSHFYPNEDVILLFFQMFRDDILDSFLGRWRSAGRLADYFPIIFGPYDYDASSTNTRKCCVAAYHYENLEQRQLVRPVPVLQDNIVVRNHKTTDDGIVDAIDAI